MSDKRIFIVHGSEDGILEAGSNIKAAYRIACEYAQGCCDNNPVKSYAKVVNELKKYSDVNVCIDEWAFGTAKIFARNLTTK